MPLRNPPLLSSLAALGLVCGGPGCGDDAVCGSEEDSQTQITGELASESVTWENWRSSPNNDCGETGGPISLTVEADQAVTMRGLTLCLPRPDKLSGAAVDVNDASLVRVIDVFADVEGVDCLATLERTTPASGTLAFPGICDDGQHPDGYSIVFDLQLPVTITCAQDTRSEVMRFSGSVAVTPTILP